MTIPYHPETIDEILERDRLEYREMENPIREDELKDPHRNIKIELLGIIAAYQDPVCSNRIFRDYEEINGCPLDPHELGFKSFSSMMRVFSDKFNYHQDGLKTTYTAKTTERSAHLQDLIKNQVTIEEKRRRDMRRSRSFSRPRKSSYGAAAYYSQKFVPLLAEDDRTAEERLADSLASFGRSWGAAEEARGGGLNWGGRKMLDRLESSESSGEEEVEGGGRKMRSRSVPAPRSMTVYDDPRAKDDDDLEDCTNPFRVENNVRVRDVVIKYGEEDDTGRKGMALIEVAQRFKQEYRVPLGGIPGLSEARLMTKMAVVSTSEWEVEKMGDDVAYVIVPVETLKRAHEVGPGTPSTPPAGPTEKPKSSGVSPAAKRMFGFALKEALSVNKRQTGTKEKNLLEREVVYSEIVAGSDGDPVLVEEEVIVPVVTNPMCHRGPPRFPMDPREPPRFPMDPREPPRFPMDPSPRSVPSDRHTKPSAFTRHTTPSTFNRDTMMSLSDHDSLEPKVEALAGSMRILRSQTSPNSGSSHSSVSSRSGRMPVRPLPRITPLVSSSNMFSDKQSSGFGGAVPSFGTFKSAPPPARVAVADSDDDVDPSDILQPSKSNLAGMLPKSSFGKPVTSVFAPKPMAVAPSGISFGTSSQSVPSPTPVPRSSAPSVPSFGTVTSFPSAFGGAAKKPLIEVIESEKEEERNGAEVLGATIQLIGRLQAGEKVYLKEMERTPLEDVVADNPDFFDIDEKDEHIHLLHRDVVPELLMYDGQQLGERVEEEKGVKREDKKDIEARGMFSRAPPSFSRPVVAPSLNEGDKPSFGQISTPSFARREIPSFGRPVRIEEDEKREERPTTTETIKPAKPVSSFGAPVPSFGRPVRIEEDVKREERPTTTETIPAKPVSSFGAPLPSFGRPVKIADDEEKKEPVRLESRRDVPTFTVPSAPSRPSEPVVEKQKAPIPAPIPTVTARSNYQSPKPVDGMPSFGTKSLELQRPDSAMSTRSEEPKVREVPSFGTAPPRVVERKESVTSMRSEKTEDSTQQSKFSSATSTISSSTEGEEPIRPRVSSSIGPSSVETLEKEKKKEEVIEKPVDETDPYAFPKHKDIRSLCNKSSLALDSVRVGEIRQGSIITSFSPNRIVLAMSEENVMDNLHAIMREISAAYVEETPLGDAVVPGQFAVAINGECIVRVVVLRKVVEDGKPAFECACLDINALIMVEGENLYRLQEKFNVTAIRASTFVARVNGIADWTARGHRAVKLTVKSQENDENMKKPQPFVFHGKDETTGDLMVDVAVMIADNCVWLGEKLPEIVGDIKMTTERDAINPNIEHVLEFAAKHEIDGYEMKTKKEKKVEKVEKKKEVEEDEYDRADTPNADTLHSANNESNLHTLRSDSLEKLHERTKHSYRGTPYKYNPEDETIVFGANGEKEEGELDSSLDDDSFASERTTLDRHEAGAADFVRREVKEELPDEFVVVAPAAAKAIVDVESITSLIRLFNARGENVEVDVIKSMCRALILSTNKTLSSLGERGALIANAEALEAIEMA